MRVSATATLAGPMHVFLEADPAMLELAQRPIIGLPLCEAFPEAEYVPMYRLLDCARETRIALAWLVTAPSGDRGIVTVLPRAGDVMAVEFELLRRAVRPRSAEVPLTIPA